MASGSTAITIVYASSSSNTGSTPSTPSTSGPSSSGSTSSGSGGSSGPSSSQSSSSGSSSGSGGGSTAHCDRPGYPSCSSLGTQAAQNAAPGSSCPPGHSKAFCSAYNGAAGGSTTNNPPSSSTLQTSGAHCDAPGYPSCYTLGYADGKNHPGTSCPSGHSQNYCKGYEAGAGSSASSNNTTGLSLQADVAHCDQTGWPSCYSVGFQDGKAHPGTPCPSGHSADFCSGWNAGAGNTAHCGSARYPSCYSIGYADGLQHLGASCPNGHTPSYCAGWNAAAGNTTHCDRPGWPSCYDVGYEAGKANPGTSCPSGHSQAYCNGYATGAGTAPLLDTHCDTPGYPSCYSLGYQAGKSAALGTPCPSGHSMNYCSGWEVGNRLLPNELLVTDASYKTAQNTPIDITLSAKDPDPTAKVTISIVSQPTHGNIKSTGSLNRYSYTPNPGFSGIDSFQYSASDDKGIKSNVGTISISVGSTTPPSPNGSLKILSQTHYIDSVDAYHVVGEVENNSSKTASYVEIIGTFYDANGTVVGTSFTFTEPHDLASGAKAPFDLILISASVPINQIKHYSLQLNSQ